jgi:ATP-binding cassette subfamily B protein
MPNNKLYPAFFRSIKIIIKAAPTELSHLIVLTLISGAAPAVTLFFNKVIIDEASRLLRQGLIANAINLIQKEPLLLWSIGGLILLNLLSESMNTITHFVFCSLQDRIQGFVEERVLYKVANFEDIALFETPELLNLVQLAKKGVMRLQQLSFILITTLNGLFSFVPAVLLSGSIVWWVPVILFTSVSPSVYVELKYQKQSWRVEQSQAGIAREMNLYKDVLMGEAYAKELRLFRLQSFLLERWHNLFWQMFHAMQRVRQQGTILILAASLLSGLGAAVSYIYVVLGALNGFYTLGDLALYTGLILQARRSLFLLINNSSDLYDIVLGTSPIFQILELKSQLRSSLPITDAVSETSNKKGSQTPSKKQVLKNLSGIQINHLSFCYPASNKKVIDNISLKIQPNEMIALVGENGGGKTTLAKLLCRLYDPTSGNILWNGQDVRELDLDELRSRIAVVMQDYARFPATVRENVSFGYLPLLHDDFALKQVIQEVGITKMISHLPQGLETPLGKQLEGGVDLSGGQWQKIALARSLMRLFTAELLIFDEPTAALDPKTEYEIYNIFRSIASGRISVIVSHRLALAKLADRIFVLENGKIRDFQKIKHPI